jgi:hypothetical protein
VGAIVLAVSQSKLKGLADRSTLKAVVGGQYQDLVKDGDMHLQVLWDLLKDLPGFESDDAKGPFCMIKSWETDFVLKVELPEALADLSDSDQSRAAAHCTVSSSQKAQALFPDDVVVQPTPSSGSNRGRMATQAKMAPSGGGTKRLIAVLIVSIVIAGGITAYKMFSKDGNAVALSSISADLPIKEATRKGATLNLRLEGNDWFSGQDAPRKAAMQSTLRSVAAIQIDTIMVFDSTGNFRASAQWFGNPPVITVRLKK